MASLQEYRMPRKVAPTDQFLGANALKASATTDQLDSLYFRERETAKSSANEWCETAICELSQLDASLEDLFKDSHIDFDTHQQIHKFRLRVSRRISAFASILRRLFKHIESTSSANKLKLESLYNFYTERLMRHKNKLSKWWSRNERRYHSMCLSSFVSEAEGTVQLDKEENYVDGEEEFDIGDDKEDSEIVMKLKATRSMMVNQINQMSATETSMLKSSNYIVRQEEVLAVLKKRFTSASQLFKSVRRRTINRYGTVRVCYFAFIGACGFITLRRFRVFKLCLNITKLALFPALYVARFFYGPS